MSEAIHLSAFNFASGSPNNSSEESLANDDSLMFFDEFDTMPDTGDDFASNENGDQPKRKSRRPPSTAERRATHNAVERARRETLNGRFMDLAAALPTMAAIKRPSKSTIVNKSLEFVQTAVAREQTLLAENDALRVEVNELRARLGLSALAAPQKPAPIKVVPRRRQTSLVSLGSEDSPLLVNSPLTASSAFDGPKDACSPTSLLPTTPTELSSIPESQVSTPSTAASMPVSVGSVPSLVSVAPSTFPNGYPMVDMSYLMALSMQQQQAQSMLQMTGGNPFAFTSPWPTMPVTMPVSTAPDFASNWLFS